MRSRPGRTPEARSMWRNGTGVYVTHKGLLKAGRSRPSARELHFTWHIRPARLLSPNPPMRSSLGVRTRGEGRGTRGARRDSMQGKTIADRAGATLWGGWVVWWTGQAPSVPSGRQWQGSQSSQGASELGFPRPALWQMQSEAAGRAGEPSGQGEEAPPEGPGGHHTLVQTDARGPAGQVMGQHLTGTPTPMRGTGARRRRG